jgi:hypothetical protein
MGVAAEIVEHQLRAAEGSLRVDDPLYLAPRSQIRADGGWREVSEEAQRTGVEVAFSRCRNSRR